jgi:hypothetical protein
VSPFYWFEPIEKDDVSLKIKIILTLMRQSCPSSTVYNLFRHRYREAQVDAEYIFLHHNTVLAFYYG